MTVIGRSNEDKKTTGGVITYSAQLRRRKLERIRKREEKKELEELEINDPQGFLKKVLK